MSRKSKLTGMRFGSLVAVDPLPETKNGYTVWRCLCDCGRVARFPSRHLKKGWARSCGNAECPYCEADRKMHARYEDLTGKRFGKLLVTGMAERDEKGRIQWNCVCDCGGTVTENTGQLIAGYRKSCGCLFRPPLKDWVGKKFGMLTVTAYDGKRQGKHWWKCTCDCGNEVVVCQSSLNTGHTTSCGCRNTPYAARTLVDGTCVEALRGAVEKKTVAKNNSSGIRGVYRNKRNNRWCAQITFQGKTRYLGSYDTLREAKLARERGEEIFQNFLDSYDARKGDARKGDARKAEPADTADA